MPAPMWLIEELCRKIIYNRTHHAEHYAIFNAKWKCDSIRYGQSNLNLWMMPFQMNAVLGFLNWAFLASTCILYNYIHLINVNSSMDFIYLFWLNEHFFFLLILAVSIKKGFFTLIHKRTYRQCLRFDSGDK